MRATGVTVFPGWELYAPAAGATETFFDLLPNAQVLIDEPDALTESQDAWWTKLDRSPRTQRWSATWYVPEDLYLSPEQWNERLQPATLVAVEQLGIEVERRRRAPDTAVAADHALPWLVAAMAEEVEQLTREGKRVIFAVSSTRRSRAAGRRLQRVQPVVPHRQPHAEAGRRSFRRRIHLLRGRDDRDDHREGLRARRRRRCPRRISSSLARAICLTKQMFLPAGRRGRSRRSRRSSPTSAISPVGDYVVHVEHGIGQYQGLKEIPQEDGAPPSSWSWSTPKARGFMCRSRDSTWCRSIARRRA